MEKITLYEEYRFIEKAETEVNGAWKGAHLLLFFLAFVFGSFCTFCFHMLMYLFDEKCVLFPKLLSLTSFRQNIIYEFIPEDKEIADMLPVDFLSTQWVEKSACLLPTYVPLVSGIFGLVWTTMFLMCSTGSRVLTGLQRPWRVVPPVFLFSLAMGILCVYTSAVTHFGLQELCLKLSEITGSPTCTYTINVATLAYERRIRGVYQATRLTILSAWLHTACWVLSAVLALLRVLLAVDFQLVKVSVTLRGNIDRMLERHEKHIRTVSPEMLEANRAYTPVNHTRSLVQIHFKKKEFRASLLSHNKQNIITDANNDNGDLLYYSGLNNDPSEHSLVQTERKKLDIVSMYNKVAKQHRFIVKILYNIIQNLDSSPANNAISTTCSLDSISESTPRIMRQYGQQRISSRLGSPVENQEIKPVDLQEAKKLTLEIKRHLKKQLSELYTMNDTTPANVASSSMNTELKRTSSVFHDSNNHEGKNKDEFKSNLKQVGIQTEDKVKDKSVRVQIDSHTNIFDSETSTGNDEQITKENKETQTKKEKQE